MGSFLASKIDQKRKEREEKSENREDEREDSKTFTERLGAEKTDTRVLGGPGPRPGRPGTLPGRPGTAAETSRRVSEATAGARTAKS